MYYLVSEWQNRKFIFDTTDSSCECLSDSMFKDLVSSYSIKISSGFKQMSFAKFVTLFSKGASCKQCSYLPLVKFSVDVNSSKCKHIAELGIYLIKGFAITDSDLKNLYMRAGYKTNIMAFLHIEGNEYSDTNIINSFTSLSVKGSYARYLGLVSLIPLDFVSYLIQLRGRQDFDRLQSALNGFNMKNCFTRNVNAGIEYSDIVWSDSDWNVD